MKFRNLLIVSNIFPDEKNMFVGDIFVEEQLRHLKNYFKNVTVISPVPLSFGMTEDDKYCKNYFHGNVKVYFPRFFHLPITYFRNRFGDNYFKSINNLIKKEKIKFDLVHAHFAWPSGYAGTKLKEKYNTSLIITVHGFDIYDVPFRNSMLEKKIKYTLNSADYIITVSNSNLNYISKLNTKTPIKIIPNGYSNNLFYPIPKDRARKKLNLHINKKIILTVGNLVEVKGHKYLIQTMKEIVKKRKDVMCIIVGSGRLKRKLEKLIKELNLRDYVKLVGAKPHEEIPLWMNACDIFVLPSIAEGFPTVLPEILACGKPVVATKVGGISEIINKEVGILAEPKSPEELAESLNKALEKEWNIPKIMDHSKKFNWEEISQQIIKIYEQVLK